MAQEEKDLILVTVYNALQEIANKWFEIGLQLGIPRNKLLEFKDDPSPLSAVIDYWIKGNLEEHGASVSWKSIVTAVRSVKEIRLADQISKQYCQQVSGSAIHQPSPTTPYQKATPDVPLHQETPSEQHQLPTIQPKPPPVSSPLDTQPSPSKPLHSPKGPEKNQQSSASVTDEVTEDLMFILKENLQAIISKYASYVHRLCKLIEAKGESPESLRLHILSLSFHTTDEKRQSLAPMSKKRTELEKCKTVNEIFTLLATECASFLNYEIFQEIQTHYKIGEDEEELKYADHLKAYIEKHKISEIAKVIPQLEDEPKDCTKMILKFDVELTCKFAHIVNLKQTVAKILKIHPSALQIVGVQPGSVIVTFIIPTHIADTILKRLSSQQENELRTASVIWLKYNGNTFHFRKKKEDTHPGRGHPAPPNSPPTSVATPTELDHPASPNSSLTSVATPTELDHSASPDSPLTSVATPTELDTQTKGYFDIMVIGGKGMGKSTTADKIIIANPLGIPYKETPQEIIMRDDNEHIQCGDLHIWHLYSKSDDVDRVKTRLTNLVYCRSIEEPHRAVNNFHMEGDNSGSTDNCELLSNESTRVRVLDVPGFHGADASSTEAARVEDQVLAGAKRDLEIMKKILHIKRTKNFKFNRIVYFLPESGALTRDSQILQTEIAVMWDYFDKSIFECMIIAATYPADIHTFLDKKIDLFPKMDQLQTKYFFSKAIKKFFNSKNVPEPSPIYISLSDTCENILQKIKDSPVPRKGAKLQEKVVKQISSLSTEQEKVYFDIMAIGCNGVGKKTTVDKILIANPLGIPYEGPPYEEPVWDKQNMDFQLGDMHIWHPSNSYSKVEQVAQRLNNLFSCRSMEEPHIEVNNLYMHGESSGSTENCELLSNDTTMVRVLDIHKFYSTATEGVLDLNTMKDILNVKMTKNFKFNRIVYFLPENGDIGLSLQTEISILKDYFGKDIFETMVVVATYPDSALVDTFMVKDQPTIKHLFHEAMKTLLLSQNVPEPPVIIISPFDKCENVLQAIQNSNVSRERARLEFKDIKPSQRSNQPIHIQQIQQSPPKLDDIRSYNSIPKSKDIQQSPLSTSKLKDSQQSTSKSQEYERSTQFISKPDKNQDNGYFDDKILIANPQNLSNEETPHKNPTRDEENGHTQNSDMPTPMSALDKTPVPSPLPPDDEDVKQSQKSSKSSIQQGIDDKLVKYYFDIMVIGKTGVGKSTTADKILIANPDGILYEGAPYEEPTRNEENRHIQYSDMSMWHVSNKPNEVQRVETRLKNLVFCRSLEDPHIEVNTFHVEGEHSASTEHCELLSNDSTMVRVLDVPGFHGADACSTEASSSEDRALAGAKNDLSITRKILHIKMANNFKFNRIVYFLPENGALKRYSLVLHTEIAIMENYFGKSIFESMVVVATYPASVYKFLSKTTDLFPEKDQLETKCFFNEAMKKVFQSEDVPEPPIIFISLLDTCEDIFHKIKDSHVSREGVELQFNPSTCARCNIKIGTLREDHKIEHQDGILAICAHDNNWAAAIPYEDSTCHPMMIPKYSILQKVAGGIAHLITLNMFLGKWPSFYDQDEVCIRCGQGPKSRGCTKVRTMFTKESGEILVDHHSEVDESYVIKIDESFGEASADTAATVGATGVLTTDTSGVRGYTTTSVNYTTQD